MSSVSDFRVKDGVLKKYTGSGRGVVIPDGVAAIEDRAFEGCSNLKSLIIPDGVTAIGNEAFSGCSNLISIDIPDSVTVIGEWAFSGCSSLTSITIPDGAEFRGSIFRDCNGLADAQGFVIVQNVLHGYIGSSTDVFIPDGVTVIWDWAFDSCESLKNVTIPNSVKTIGNWAFNGCSNLTNITIPDSVMSIGNFAFDWCSNLTNITIPSNVTSIGDMAFSGCSRLTGISIPDGVTEIRHGMFSGCVSLTSIALPDSIMVIGESAFSTCMGLMSITLPNGATVIGKQAFAQDTNLTSVMIPDSVTTIGDKAFDGCWNLGNLTISSALSERLSAILPKGITPILHVEAITEVSAKYRPGAAVGFAEDNRDITDKNGLEYAKYIKTNAAKLAPLACEHPALLYFMLRKKLVDAKHLETVSKAVQASGDAELIAAILEYGTTVSEKAKARVQAKKEEREERVTSFIFDTEKLEVLRGKTIVVTGKLETFSSRDELRECLSAVGAALTETLSAEADFLLTNTPNSGTAKNKKAEELGVRKITEKEFNNLIGRHAE